MYEQPKPKRMVPQLGTVTDKSKRMLSGLRSTRVIADESLDGFLVLGVVGGVGCGLLVFCIVVVCIFIFV